MDDLSADVGEKTDVAGTKTESVAGLQKEFDAGNAKLVKPKWDALCAPPKK